MNTLSNTIKVVVELERVPRSKKKEGNVDPTSVLFVTHSLRMGVFLMMMMTTMMISAFQLLLLSFILHISLSHSFYHLLDFFRIGSLLVNLRAPRKPFHVDAYHLIAFFLLLLLLLLSFFHLNIKNALCATVSSNFLSITHNEQKNRSAQEPTVCAHSKGNGANWTKKTQK